VYVLEATPLSPHTTAEVEAAIYAEIEKVKKGPIAEREIETARTKFKKDFVDGLVDNLGLASILAANRASLGDWREGFKRAEAVSKVTAADVQRVASTYLKTSNRTVSTLVKPQAEAVAASPEETEKASALLAGAVAKIGGAKALSGLKDVRTTSTVTITTPQGSIEGQKKELVTRDNRLKSELSIMGQSQVHVYDGEKAWVATPAGAQDAPPDVVEDLKSALTRNWYLWTFDPKAVQGAIRPLPDQELNGAAVHAVEVTPPAGKPFVILLDKTSHQPVGETYDTDNPITGQPGRAEIVYTDWKTVKGISFPGKSQFRMDGQTIIEETITDITINAGVNPEDFRRPS
jgi:hypothetical protein